MASAAPDDLSQLALARPALKAPNAAAIAGIIFSVLLITSLVLFHLTLPSSPLEEGNWLSGKRRAVEIALNLIPFAGIAFLWFIGVVRDRIGALEDRLFATVFLGSGLLFLAMLFASAAVAGSLLLLYDTALFDVRGSEVYAFGRATTYEIMNVYCARMAGVFMISTSTLSIRTQILPRWMSFLGVGLALILLLSIGTVEWIMVIFPLWVLLVSVYILIANFRRHQGARMAAPATAGQ